MLVLGETYQDAPSSCEHNGACRASRVPLGSFRGWMERRIVGGQAEGPCLHSAPSLPTPPSSRFPLPLHLECRTTHSLAGLSPSPTCSRSPPLDLKPGGL